VFALAERIAGNDQRLIRKMKENYNLGAATTMAEALEIEQRDFGGQDLPPEEVARRRERVMDRGRSQTR
jgi:enoyl-CoA hydratase/carnithine racemase